MKKYVMDKMRKKWIKVVAACINVISLVYLIISIMVISFFSRFSNEEKALEYGYSLIMQNYAADILDNMDILGALEAATKYEDSNMRYSVYKNNGWPIYEDNIQFSEVEPIFSNGDHYEEYILWSREGCTFFGYNTESLYKIMTGELKYDVNFEKVLKGRNEENWNNNEQIKDEESKESESVTGTEGTEPESVDQIVMETTSARPEENMEFADEAYDYYTVTYAVSDHIKEGDLIYDWTRVVINVYKYEVLIMIGCLVSVLLYAMSVAYFALVGENRVVGVIVNASSGLTHRVKKAFEHKTPIVIRVFIVLSLLTIVELAAIFLTNKKLAAALIVFVVYKVLEYTFVLRMVHQMWLLQKGVENIAQGKLEEKINLNKMRGIFKKHGMSINKVGEGISLAVGEQMKSERMKTELITNVSHDIKTPLTSIINYVDLIKKEDVQNEKLMEYVGVLDRQSTRLKKLINDLMDASKAATRNIEVNLEMCDVKVLLSQALGEFDEKLLAASLTVEVLQPEGEAMAMVDGRHLWRVFDNIINNICKYAMEGTRVYIDVECIDGNDENGMVENDTDAKKSQLVQVTFKNISRSRLNISPDELMERFVRGDSSRHTEGSGLGLSIARSLTELMGGCMKLDIDGDLFKLTLLVGGSNE